MRYFAELDDKNVVVNVIVAEEDVASLKKGRWVETFPPVQNRRNYAGIGHTYDSDSDSFVAPKSAVILNDPGPMEIIAAEAAQ